VSDSHRSRAYAFTAYGGPEVEALVQRPVPSPGDGQLLIAVRAAGVNPADWKIREGWLSEAIPRSFPAVFGIEVAGVVEGVGPGGDGYAVGDEVFGRTLALGSFADHALLPVSTSARKPAGVSFVNAASLTIAAGTAYEGLRQLDVREGETLLVNGVGGGLGVAAAQLGRLAGATVIGIASRAKAPFVESLGVAHVSYEDDPVRGVLTLAPNGVDAIFDMVGAGTMAGISTTLGPGGRTITAAADETPAGAGIAGVRPSRDLPAVLRELADLVEKGSLDPKVTDTFPLERAGTALRLVEGRHVTGKIALEP
jgi:NADPH:quinone reductase-like Zn-dependent oxidoreductase